MVIDEQVARSRVAIYAALINGTPTPDEPLRYTRDFLLSFKEVKGIHFVRLNSV